MNYAIQLEHLRWRAGSSFTLQDVDLSVPRGSIYGFLGPNGSGKTTTIRLFLGMMRPDAGEIRVLDGRVPGDLPHILRRVGYVPERPHVYRALTVGDQIRFHASFYPLWDPIWAKELLERLDLDPGRKIARLSKGENGKLLALLALAQRPELLVLDEPTDGLDPVVRRDVMTTVLDYVSESGATVFISSHLVHELERICDWVGVMDGGRLVTELPMNAFKNEIKRIRVVDPPESDADAPFHILSREKNGIQSGEVWVVRGWRDPMRSYFERAGARVKDVMDLDLEEGFVELLRSSRPSNPRR